MSVGEDLLLVIALLLVANALTEVQHMVDLNTVKHSELCESKAAQ